MLTMAFSASSAMSWDPADDYTVGDINNETLTSTLALPGAPSLTCNVSFEASLDGGTTNPGEVFDSTIQSCVTTVDDCAVDVVGNTPWDVSGTNTGGGSGTVSISNVSFTATYTDDGANCSVTPDPATSCDFDVEGTVNADYDASSGEVTFGSGGDSLATANSGCNVPNNTGVDLTGTVTVQGTPPELE